MYVFLIVCVSLSGKLVILSTVTVHRISDVAYNHGVILRCIKCIFISLLYYVIELDTLVCIIMTC